MTLEQIVAKLDTGAASATSPRRSTQKEPFDVLVVGGGPGRCDRGDLRRPQGHPHGRRRRALRRPGARHDGHRELHLGAVHRGPEARRARSSSTCAEYDVDVMNLQRRDAARAGRRAGRADHGRARERRVAAGPLGHRSSTGARWRDGRPRRGGVPQQGRDVLPALRRPAVQGQARRRDRRRQLRRRGGDRPRRHRRPRHADRVRRRSCAPTRCCSASCAACRTSTSSSAR